MSDASAIRAGKAVVELGVDDRLAAGLNKASAKLKAYGATVGAAGRSLMTWGGAVLAPLALAGRSFARASENLGLMSERTGASTQFLSALDFAARVSGTSLEDLEPLIKRFQVKGHAAGQTTEAAFLAAADQIAAVTNPSERAAKACELFGKKGTALLPMFKAGSAGVRGLMLEAQRLGVVMSQADVAAGQAFNDVLERLEAVSVAAWRTLGAALTPALKSAADWLVKAAGQASAWIRAHQPILILALKLAAGVAAAGVALFALGTILGGAGIALKILSFAVPLISAAFSVLAAVLGAICTPIGAVAATFLIVTETWRPLYDLLSAGFKTLLADAKLAFGGIADALATGDIAAAANILWLALKLEWTRGVNALAGLWEDFKSVVVNVGTSMGQGLVEVWQSIATGFIIAVGFMERRWNDFAVTVMSLWNRMTTQPTRTISEFIGYLRSGAALRGQSLDEYRRARAYERGIGQGRAEDLAQGDTQGQIYARNAASAAWVDSVSEAIRIAARKANSWLGSARSGRIESRNEADAAGQAEIAKALAALRAASSAATAARSEADLNRRIDHQLDAFFGPIERMAGGARLAMETGSAAGTFSSHAAQVLGAGSAADRTARACESIVENTSRLPDLRGAEFDN